MWNHRRWEVSKKCGGRLPLTGLLLPAMANDYIDKRWFFAAVRRELEKGQLEFTCKGWFDTDKYQ
jgi:hypothetical protein